MMILEMLTLVIRMLILMMIVACLWNCRTCREGLLELQILPTALRMLRTFSFVEQAHHPLLVSQRKTWGHNWPITLFKHFKPIWPFWQGLNSVIHDSFLFHISHQRQTSKRIQGCWRNLITLCGNRCHGLQKNPRSRWRRYAEPSSEWHAWREKIPS